jgi:hypothetical protein
MYRDSSGRREGRSLNRHTWLLIAKLPDRSLLSTKRLRGKMTVSLIAPKVLLVHAQTVRSPWLAMPPLPLAYVLRLVSQIAAISGSCAGGACFYWHRFCGTRQRMVFVG